MTALKERNWVPKQCEAFIQQLAQSTYSASPNAISERLDQLIIQNREIHEKDCFTINPATNVMNPKAEAALSAGLGSRPSLGYPGDKYEMGLEAIEEIEVICAELCAEVFNADFAEIRVAGRVPALGGRVKAAKFEIGLKQCPGK